MSELMTLLSSGGSVFEIFAGLLVLHLIYQRIRRRVKVYLLDFTCYRAPDSIRIPMSTLIETIYLDKKIDQESIDFHARILERSWLSNQTSIPPTLMEIPLKKSLSAVRIETMTTLFTSVDDLLKKNKLSPRSIDILITNCSLHAPTPSLSAMVINKFHMRSNIKSFNLSGMGCAAGILSVGLANNLLKVHRGSLALIVSTYEARGRHLGRRSRTGDVSGTGTPWGRRGNVPKTFRQIGDGEAVMGTARQNGDGVSETFLVDFLHV